MPCNFSRRKEEYDMELKMGKEVLPHFSKFKYLGSILHNEVEINKDATHRIYAGWLKWIKASGIICDHTPWYFYMSNYTWWWWMWPKIQNKNARIQGEIGVQSIDKKITENQWWFRHVQRTPWETLVRTINCMVFSHVKRRRGRPRRTLEEVVKKDLMVNNIAKTLIFDWVK